MYVQSYHFNIYYFHSYRYFMKLHLKIHCVCATDCYVNGIEDTFSLCTEQN